MRAIKFEIMDKTTSEKEVFILDNEFDCISGWLEDRILRQYIGIKDINGKDVCDGDKILVRYGKHYNEKQGITRGGVIVWDNKNAAFMVSINDSRVLIPFNMVIEFKITGNIHEKK